MFVYEYANDILLVDCGMGFPSEDMLGVDILIPDITYLKNKLPNIRGLVLTHGHEDHTGALPYILPQLPPIPIYASRLTASLVMEKLADYQNMPKTVKVFNPGQPIQLGSFSVESVRISHSIPDATNLIIQTPVGTIYHGSDFKFDFTPVDGVQPEVGRIGAAGNSGIKLLLSDCLGSERKGYTPSEKSLDEMFEREISHCPGKFIVTTMSSNISRFRQAAEAAQRHGRRIAILGRSIDRNIKVAQSLDYLKIPSAIMVDSKDIRRIPPHNLCLFVAGSQGQSGSALERIAMGDHRDVTIQPGDKVVFSSDYIPGSESAVQGLIDTLSKLGATVIYSNITDDLHVSGHGSRQDLLLMMSLTRPKFLLPIGGTYRHMVQYSLLAQNMGYQPQAILLPQYNQTIDVTQEGVSLGEKVDVKNIMVDGLGVGDVGSVVLRDRQVLAEEGVVVAVIEVNQNDFSQIANVDLITRGFIFAKENTALLNLATAAVKKSISARQGKIDSTHYIRQLTGDVLENFFWEKTRRRPMILPVIVEV
jgi:ribonuclease J